MTSLERQRDPGDGVQKEYSKVTEETVQQLDKLQEKTQLEARLRVRFNMVMGILRATPTAVPPEHDLSPRFNDPGGNYKGYVAIPDLKRDVSITLYPNKVWIRAPFEGPIPGSSWPLFREYHYQDGDDLSLVTVAHQARAWLVSMDEMLDLKDAGKEDEFLERYKDEDLEKSEIYKKEARFMKENKDKLVKDPETGILVFDAETFNRLQVRLAEPLPDEPVKSGPELADSQFQSLLRTIIRGVTGATIPEDRYVSDNEDDTDGYHSQIGFDRGGKSYVLEFRANAYAPNRYRPNRNYKNLNCVLYEVGPEGSRKRLKHVGKGFAEKDAPAEWFISSLTEPSRKGSGTSF